MPTDTERREVARRLRALDYSDLQESLICAYLDALGIKGYEDWIGIAHRLADLIEPKPERTCQIVSAFDTDELEDAQDGIAFSPEDTLAYMCKSCGFDFRYERGLYPNYCPNCGAKKVVRDGK